MALHSGASARTRDLRGSSQQPMSPQGAPRRTAPRPTAKLIIRENGSERIVDLKVRTTIGRAQENDITIDDINSSRRHCQIERNANGYEIVDLKSRNGTLVNGILVLRKDLRPGDCIEIGKTKMFFDHVSSEFAEETIDLSTDHFLEPLSGLGGDDKVGVLTKEREIFLKLFEINRNMNSKVVVSDLLDVIIDTVVEVTGAERGFLLLPDGGEGRGTASRHAFDETVAGIPASGR